jgi:hypothetical protein
MSKEILSDEQEIALIGHFESTGSNPPPWLINKDPSSDEMSLSVNEATTESDKTS